MGELMDIPTRIQLLLNGEWHTISIDHNDRDVQKAARVLVMMMLRSAVGETPKNKLCEYTVRVFVNGAKEEITIKTYSPLDARVMAFILKGAVPEMADQEEIITLAYANTEIV
jgi:hypothetical protein